MQEQAAVLATTKLRQKKDCRIGGYAGTGKTTLISNVVDRLKGFDNKILIMAPTGKAANVLCNKGVDAATIHRTIYNIDENSRELQFVLRSKVEADYFIVDESSMLSTDLYKDIKSFGIPTLFIGDPAQLEPVGDDAKLMHNADTYLTEIHRTAQESAIIKFATALRTTPIHPFAYRSAHLAEMLPSSNLDFRDKTSLRRSEWLAFDQIIVGKNTTRNIFNQTFKKSPNPLPVTGDKIICLRNDYSHGVFNGEIFFVCSDEYQQEEQTGELCLKLRSEDGHEDWYPFWREYFFDQTLPAYNKPRSVVWFDYAWAITCHKSQGSEWNNIAVVDEAFGSPPNRWRYTAATRAAKHLTWIKA